MVQDVAWGLMPGREEGLLAEDIPYSEVGLFDLLSDFLIFMRLFRGDIAVSKVRMRV